MNLGMAPGNHGNGESHGSGSTSEAKRDTVTDRWIKYEYKKRNNP